MWNNSMQNRQIYDKGIPSQSYIMSSGSIQSGSFGGRGHDGGGGNGEESHPPISINSYGNTMQGQHDSVGPSSSDSHQPGQNGLKVEDALNYLDQVKHIFGNQPQVYNDFLDIMKEFKSQSIDTPGVISRVSNLFRDHPGLIVGFNTFLPPGYKIEIQTNDQGSQISYRVDGVASYVVTNMPACAPDPSSGSPQVHSTLPQFTETTITTTSGPYIRNPQTISTGPPNHSKVSVTSTFEEGSIGGSATSSSSSAGLSRVEGISNGNVSPSAVATFTLTPTSTNLESFGEPASCLTNSLSSPFVQNAFPSLQSQPVQFNHAINYVNKIKTRFCEQPDKYQQFMDILHYYQREKGTHDELEVEVYSQVANLFTNQEDLLEEFNQFISESNQPAPAEPAIVAFPLVDNVLQQPVQDADILLEQVVKPSTLKPLEYHTTTVTQPPAHNKIAPKRPSTASRTHAISKKAKLEAPRKDISLAEAERYGTVHDFAFFDECRNKMSQQAYYSFIRCANLFNNKLVSRQELLILVQPLFSNNTEMYGWFKKFVNDANVNDRDQGMNVGEPISQTRIAQDHVPEEQFLEIGDEYFSTCERLGANYFPLPENQYTVNSESRSDLCKQVLNDEWVSYPLEEGSKKTRIGTRKLTPYEKYTYRCEEVEDERFELDSIIEANADTIRTLEAVARRMARLSHENLKNYELNDTLGGTSAVIHQRTIRRVYGEKAVEIIEGLKQKPFLVIPMVLKRLKSKEDEWRESQRNFNKIWRNELEWGLYQQED